jgi:hypothetical protein
MALLTLVEQLRALGGVPPDTDVFTIALGTHPIKVHYSGGSTESLNVCTQYPVGWYGTPLTAPRPMAIRLSLEQPFHLTTKSIGLNRELQFGDHEFDRRIYIDSQAPDAAILAALQSQAARIAVVHLCQLGASVCLDDADGDINCNLSGFAERDPDQSRAARVCDALERLTSAVTPIAPTLVRAAPDWPFRAILAAFVLGLLFLAIPIILLNVLAESHCSGITSCLDHPDCCAPAAIGTGAGMVITLPLMLVFWFAFRGRSDSSTRFGCASMVTLAWAVMFCVSVARIFW